MYDNIIKSLIIIFIIPPSVKLILAVFENIWKSDHFLEILANYIPMTAFFQKKDFLKTKHYEANQSLSNK